MIKVCACGTNFEARGRLRHCGADACKRALRSAWKPRDPTVKQAHDRKYYEKNAERLREKQRQYVKANADAVRLAARARYMSNADARRAKAAERRRADDSVRASYRRRYAENPAPFIAAQAARRARCAGAVSGRDVRTILASCDGRCAYCFASGKLELDHVVPLSRGGQHAPENLAPACQRCNRSKRDELLSEWLWRPTGQVSDRRRR